MAKTIKYTGIERRWPELAITGKQSVWFPGQQEERSDAEAALLLRTGMFADLSAAAAVSPASLVEGKGASQGVLICSWQVSPSATGSAGLSSTDPFFNVGLGTAAPQLSGAGSTYVAATDVANVPSTFKSIKISVKASRRQDGTKFAYVQLSLGTDNTFANRMLCSFTVRADGKVRDYVLQLKQFGTAGSFTIGTDTFSWVRFSEQAGSGAASVTFTASLAAGATSGTLTAGFAGATGDYPVRFSNNETRVARLINGSTAANWNAALTSAATTSMSYYPVRVAMQAGDTVQFGALFRDPVSKAMLGARFDDCTLHQVVASTRMTSDFVGASGITVPAGAYSMCELAEKFGFRATLYLLTRHVGQPGGFANVAQLLAAQARGHLLAFQTHANPFDGNNAGARLLGPYGYDLASFVYGAVSASTVTSRLTTTNPHKVISINSGGQYGDQGYKVQFYGTSLPAPLDTTTQYWLGAVDANNLTVHLTEADSVAGTNPITLTSNGGAGTWGYRYWGSAPDHTAILADFRAGQALMQQWGFTGWRHYAPNQGGWDAHVEEAVRILMDEGSILTVNGTQGNTGAAAASFFPRSPAGFVGGGLGFASNLQVATSLSDIFNLPVALDTDAASQATSQAFCQAVSSLGAIAFNYHHHQATSAKMQQQCAYYDAALLCIQQGLAVKGTAEDAYQMLKAAGAI